MAQQYRTAKLLKEATVLTNSANSQRGEQGNKDEYIPINNWFGEGEWQKLQEVY